MQSERAVTGLVRADIPRELVPHAAVEDVLRIGPRSRRRVPIGVPCALVNEGDGAAHAAFAVSDHLLAVTGWQLLALAQQRRAFVLDLELELSRLEPLEV